MREFIKETLIRVHATCTTDQYGQMSKFNLSMYSLFKDRTEEVMQYLETNPILEVCTYGGQGGIYKAITTINDREIERECSKAFDSNPNRIRNLNSW